MKPDLALGSDISHWQSLEGCNWPLAARLLEQFTIIKLSQGERSSRGGLLHMVHLLETGPIVAPGAYHFAVTKRGGWRRPEEQADAFIEAIRESGWGPPEELLEGTGIPALWLDVEWQSFVDKVLGRLFRRKVTSKRILEFIRRFIGRVQNELGVPCGIYTGRGYIRYRLRYSAELRFWPLWLAAYVDVGSGRDRVPGVDEWPEEWPEAIDLDDDCIAPVAIWQFTGRGRTLWYRRGHGKSKIDRNLARVLAA